MSILLNPPGNEQTPRIQGKTEIQETVIYITLPWIDTDLLPNAARRIHWVKRSQIAKQARMVARSIANQKNLEIPRGVDLEIDVVFYPKTRRHYDLDGLFSALKPSLDGMFDANQADDNQIKKVTLSFGEVLEYGMVRIQISHLE